jgi:acyl transferase domain-containing protein
MGGFVKGFAYDWRRHKVPPKQIAAANPLQFMLLEAADAAIAEVGGSAALDRIRTAVVVGTMFGGEFSHDLQMGLRLPETSRHLRAALARRGIPARDVERIIEAYGKKLLERMPALVDETGSFTSSTLASRLTKSFDLMGGALALDAGDCSGVSAVSAAVDMLRERECDAVLCAAGQRALDLMAYEGFSLGDTLADGPCSPFDARRSGRVPGEGAVVLILKRLADARSAGNRIHGVIRGVAVGSGTAVGEVAARVVHDARLQAGIVPGAVTALELAGSGARAIDEPELRAVAAEYGDTPAAGAVEGTEGHLGAAAAAVGIVKLTRALARGELPPTVAAGVATAGCPAASPAALPLVAVDASGYRAGAVTVVHDNQVGHIVMDNGLPVPAAAREVEGADAAREKPVVAAVARPEPRVHAAGRGLVAALFPGQGSQYTDMFRGLVAESAPARSCLASLDAAARAAGCETLADVAWRPDNGMGTVVWDTQWGMYLGDLLSWNVLSGMGFAPDVIASHSFGEFPSLVAAGAWSIEDGARATRARAQAVEELGPKQGAMLSVIAGRDEVAAAIAPFVKT